MTKQKQPENNQESPTQSSGGQENTLIRTLSQVDDPTLRAPIIAENSFSKTTEEIEDILKHVTAPVEGKQAWQARKQSNREHLTGISVLSFMAYGVNKEETWNNLSAEHLKALLRLYLDPRWRTLLRPKMRAIKQSGHLQALAEVFKEQEDIASRRDLIHLARFGEHTLDTALDMLTHEPGVLNSQDIVARMPVVSDPEAMRKIAGLYVQLEDDEESGAPQARRRALISLFSFTKENLEIAGDMLAHETVWKNATKILDGLPIADDETSAHRILDMYDSQLDYMYDSHLDSSMRRLSASVRLELLSKGSGFRITYGDQGLLRRMGSILVKDDFLKELMPYQDNSRPRQVLRQLFLNLGGAPKQIPTSSDA